VYYGIKLGKKVEWYEGFPFTVVRDPQYVGCVLSILAFVVLLYSPAFIEAGLLTVAAGWTAFYFVTGLVENFL
jgi:protein-S-isoprenylcysteine O-methyltransferase Ste14